MKDRHDRAVVDQVIAMLHAEHGQTVAKAGSRLDDARTLAIRGDIEPVSGQWFNDDRFWVGSPESEQRHIVTTGGHPTCGCPDFASTSTPCEHIWAVSIVCLARFRYSEVPPPVKELQEDAEVEEAVEDDAEGEDVVARAIQDMEEYAQSYS